MHLSSGCAEIYFPKVGVLSICHSCTLPNKNTQYDPGYSAFFKGLPGVCNRIHQTSFLLCKFMAFSFSLMRFFKERTLIKKLIFNCMVWVGACKEILGRREEHVGEEGTFQPFVCESLSPEVLRSECPVLDFLAWICSGAEHLNRCYFKKY